MKRRSPYSVVDVKSVCIESIVQGRTGQACSVGIDIAKNEAIVCLYWPDKTFDSTDDETLPSTSDRRSSIRDAGWAKGWKLMPQSCRSSSGILS